MNTKKEAEEHDHCCIYESPEISKGSNQKRHSTKCRYIYEEFKIKPIIETIQTDQLRWFGNVMRLDEKTTAKKVLHLKVKGKKPRGRPRTSWLKYIDNILKERLNELKRSRR